MWWVQDAAPEDLPGLYAAADAIVNYPQRDALPVTFFEAAAAHKPVVTCWHEAYDVELVRNSFVIAKGGDVEALAEAMLRLEREMSHGERRDALAAAEDEVERNYSASASKAALRRLYGELLEVGAPLETRPALSVS